MLAQVLLSPGKSDKPESELLVPGCGVVWVAARAAEPKGGLCMGRYAASVLGAVDGKGAHGVAGDDAAQRRTAFETCPPVPDPIQFRRRLHLLDTLHSYSVRWKIV